MCRLDVTPDFGFLEVGRSFGAESAGNDQVKFGQSVLFE